MKKSNIGVIIGATLGILTGCAVSGGNRVPGNHYPPTNPDNVAVLYQDPARPFDVVGFVTVDRAIVGLDSILDRKFRAVASTLGADAVIVARYRRNASSEYRRKGR